MLVQILLITSIVLAATVLLRGTGARHQAIRRLLLIAFVAFAVVSVLLPGIWNELASVFGVGRGTDLLLYGMIVAFMGYVVTSYLRFREMEVQVTRLARRLALDEVSPTGRHGSRLQPLDRPDSAPQGEE